MTETGAKKGVSGSFIKDLSDGGMDPEIPIIEVEKSLEGTGLNQGVKNLPSQAKKEGMLPPKKAS